METLWSISPFGKYRFVILGALCLCTLVLLLNSCDYGGDGRLEQKKVEQPAQSPVEAQGNSINKPVEEGNSVDKAVEDVVNSMGSMMSIVAVGVILGIVVQIVMMVGRK